MLGTMLFAAAAVSTLEPAVEADLRCAVAMLYATGIASQKQDANKIRAFSAGSSYFAGKLAVRAPGIDLGPHIRRLTNSDTFAAGIDAEVQRCAVEAGQAMIALGQSARGD